MEKEMILKKDFYKRETLAVAKDLLGKHLVRKFKDGKRLVGKIVETEAYIGPDDKASHAYQGKVTPRNQVEYLVGGYVYIYLCYGIHWQLNVTTDGKEPECVLIRALEPIMSSGEEPQRLASGPGKLTKWMKLDKSFYGEDLGTSQRLWIEDKGNKVKKSWIVASKRIGIDYAEEWATKKWRFYIKNNEFVSRR